MPATARLDLRLSARERERIDRAAALAGLGVTVHARGLMPEGLVEMPSAYRLPDVGSVEFVVQTARQGMRGPAGELAQAILSGGDRLQRQAE